MPHATQPMTNGEKHSSQFISHLTSYPAVNDSIETIKGHPVGKKSIELADGVYSRFGKPVEPYLETPYSYARPYVQKADELADSGLSTVENHFPIVKEDTHTIIDTAKGYIWWPYSYVNDTWQDEYKKTEKKHGQGFGTLIGALISLNLRIASDGMHAIADFLGPKYDESKKKGVDYVRAGQDKFNEVAEDIIERSKQQGQQAKKQGEQYAQEGKKQAENAKEETKKQAQGAKDEAQKQTNGSK